MFGSVYNQNYDLNANIFFQDQLYKISIGSSCSGVSFMCLFIHFYSSYFSYYIIYGLAGQCLKAAPKSTEAPRPHISATSARPTQEEKEGGPRWGAHGHRVRVPEVRGGRPPRWQPSTGSQGSRPTSTAQYPAEPSHPWQQRWATSLCQNIQPQAPEPASTHIPGKGSCENISSPPS